MASTSTRSVNVAFSISGADDSRQEIDKVRKAVEDFGDEGKAAADKLTTPLENIQREFDKVENKINSGRAVTVRDASAIGQQFELLKQQIEQTFGSLEKAPAEMQVAFKRAETQLDSTKKKVRELTDAVQDQKGELKEGGEAWTGMGDGLEKIAGKYGKVVAGAGLFAAALKEGWNLGMQFNQFVGTDMSLFEESLARVGQKFNLVIRNMADLAVAQFNLVMGVIHANKDEVIAAAKDIKNGVVKQAEDLAAVVSKTGNEWDAYAKKVGVASKATNDLAAANKAATEEKLKLKKAADDAAAALKAETEEIEKQQKKLTSSTNTIAENTAMTGAYEIALRQATEQLKNQNRVVEQMTQVYGENAPQTLQAIDIQKQMQATVDDLTAKLHASAEALKQGEEAHKAAAAAILVHKASAADLAKHQTDLMSKIAAVSASTATATTGQAAATLEVYKYTDAHGKLVAMVTNVAKAEEAAAANAEKHGVALKASSGDVIGWVDAAGRMQITQQKANQTIEEATAAQERHAEAIRKTREAMDEAKASAQGLDETLKHLNATVAET
jgi:hypothetical protein